MAHKSKQSMFSNRYHDAGGAVACETLVLTA